LVTYLISIPLGIKKRCATAAASMFGPARDHRRYAVPSFLFAVLLIVLFAAAAISRSSRCASRQR